MEWPTAPFDRRLDPRSAAPIAVAVSGGGDSIAALLATAAWAERRGRPVIAISLDHGLQSAAPEWTTFAGALAGRIGAGFVALRWDGEKPGAGLAAAARTARHRLLAEAAREAGARALVLGHTADDVLEAALMRQWGSSVGSPREWSPSPAWPQGRGLFLLRPLLGLRRAALRAMLVERGQDWIEDPANDDPDRLRTRARGMLAAGDAPLAPAPDDGACAALASAVEPRPDGLIRIGRTALRTAPDGSARRFVGAALLCAAGGDRPARGARLSALTERLRGDEALAATLCGAKVVADDGWVVIVRDAGEAGRRGLAPTPLAAGQPVVWDGRFLLEAARPGLAAGPLRGLAGRLDAPQRRALARAPALARPSLPALVDAGGAVVCPILAEDGAVRALSLVNARLQAACGVVQREPAT